MTSRSQDITILPFQPEHQSEVKRLVLEGLAEHWGALDLALNSDLNDISAAYAHSVFLVAWQNDRIIGTGALIPRSHDTAEIVRMSVVIDMRRKGVGSKILQRLCEQAKQNGYKHLILETTETWHEAIEFYRQFGFQVTHRLDGNVYFSLEMTREED